MHNRVSWRHPLTMHNRHPRESGDPVLRSGAEALSR